MTYPYLHVSVFICGYSSVVGSPMQPSVGRTLRRAGLIPGPSEGAQYFGTNWARSAYLGLWCHSLRLDLRAAVEGVLGQVGPGGLGVLGDDVLEQRSASAYFLAVSAWGASGSLAWSTTQVITRSGGRLLLGRGAALDDRRHQRAVLVGLDLEGDGLGQHQVVVGLPALLGLAVAEPGLSDSSRFWISSRAFSLTVAFCPPPGGRLDQLAGARSGSRGGR